MKARLSRILAFLRPAFACESVLCRLIAAWLSFAAVNLMRQQHFFHLAFAQDTPGIAFLLIVLLFILYTFLNAWMGALPSDSWLLFAASTFCAVRWLTDCQDSENAFLFALATALLYGPIVLFCVHKNASLLQKWQPGKRSVWIVALLCGLCSCFVIASVTCYRYLTFSSPNFDFGIFVNMFHNMRESGLALVSCERDVLMSHFAVHLSPVCYILLPFYVIFPSPLTLQIAQALILASGVIPVALLCRHLKLSGKITVLMAVIYSFYPAICTGCFYDFHENCFLAPLLLWMFFFFERKQYLPMYLFAALTLPAGIGCVAALLHSLLVADVVVAKPLPDQRPKDLGCAGQVLRFFFPLAVFHDGKKQLSQLLFVHHPHECLFAPRDMLGKGKGGVVGAGNHHALDQILDAHLLAFL